MKFTSPILAVCFLQGAAAFMAPAAKPASGALNAFSYMPGQARVSEKRTSSNTPQPQVNNGALQRNQNERPARPVARAPRAPQRKKSQGLWDTGTPTTQTVQGGSLRTWSFTNPNVNRVQVVMKTEGRPMEADIDLWQGPGNTPQKMRIYSEDGRARTFNAVIETPREVQSSVAIRNTAQLEFPLSASVEDGSNDLMDPGQRLSEMSYPETIQGGALKTYTFDLSVSSVQVLLKTDGRPLNARIELLQGPTNDKQVIELYTEDGYDRPFFAVIETPGVGNVIRIVNTAPVEFPLSSSVDPYSVDNSRRQDEVLMSQGSGSTPFSNFFDSGGRL